MGGGGGVRGQNIARLDLPQKRNAARIQKGRTKKKREVSERLEAPMI